MASTAAVLSVLVKSDTSKAVTGLTALQKKLESASKSADELTDKLFYLSQLRITPKIDLDTGGAEEKTTALQGKLDRLGASSPTIEVNASTAQAREEIDRLANSDFTVHGSVDLDTGAAEAKIVALKRQAAGIGGGIGGIGGGGGSFGSAAPGGRPSSILGGGLVSAQTIGAASAFLPTIGASLAQGTLGAGALATAGAGAGIVGGAGIASVAVGGIADITKALTAYTAQQQASGAQAVQSAQQQLQAASAQHAAAQQVQTAEEGLTTAQQQETFAQQALTLARKDAVRQLTDMRRAATESTTAEQQAKLNLEVARRALAQAPAGTSALELKQLQLSAKEAQQAFRDAGIARDRAHQDANKAQRQGVGQMPQVVAAQRSLASAQKAVADASNNVKQAEYAQAQASKQAALQAKALAISQGQVGIAMKQLPQSGREATKSIVDLKDAWEKLSKPAANQFFGLISDGVHEMNRLLPMFARSAESSVGAVRDAFDGFLRSLNSPGFQKFIDVMTKTFAEGIGPLTKGFRNLLVILERIAIAAAPGLLKLLQGFREMTGDWLQSTNNAKKLQIAVAGAIRQFKDWLGLIGAVGQVLSALFIANTKGAKAGGNAVKQLTGTLQGWADWINTHRHKVNEFFINVLHTVEILGGALGNLATTLGPLSSAFVPISKAILSITTALNNLKVGNVSALTVLLGALTGKTILGKLGILSAVGRLGSIGGGAAAGEATAGEAAAGGGLLAGGSRLSGLAGKFGFAGRGAGTAIGGLRAVGAADAAMPAGLAVGGEAGGGFLASLGPVAGAAAPIAAIAVAMKAIDATGLLDAGGPVSKTPLGGLLNIPAHSMTETANGINDLSQSVDALKSTKGDLAQADIKGLTKQLRNLDKVGATTSINQGALIGKLLDQYGTFANAGRHMSHGQKQAWIDFATTAEQNGQITLGMLTKLTDGFDHSTRKWKNNLADIQKTTGESNKKTAKSFGDLNAHVSGAYNNMVEVSFAGMKMLVSSTNDLTGQLGVKQTINWTAKQLTGPSAGTSQIPGSAGAGHVAGRQRGGSIPGTTTGDSVHALLEPGEFVLNRAAVSKIGAARLEAMNSAIPRFAKGGQVPAMTAMIREADKFEAHHFPYAWGGGHSGFGIQPVDCSGFVSDILHAGGLLNTPMVSGSLMSWGKPGKGPLTVYANPEHTFMSLNGRYAGTSSSNPGGGAGWVEGGYPAGYLAGFAARTMAAAGGVMGAGVQKLKRIMIHGPGGPLHDTAQASVDKVWKGANAYIAKKTPSGRFGGGQSLAELGGGGWHRTGATQEGLTGQMGAYGTVGGMGFAELLLAGANAGMHPNVEDIIGKRIPPLGKLGFRLGSKQAIAVKNDIGSGQTGNPHFTVDIQAGLQKALGWRPNGDVDVKALQRGGMIPSFASGGRVPGPIGQPRVVVAHGGETVTPANKPSRYQITITNWKQGTGYMEEIADTAVNGQRRLGNQLSRMSRA